MAPRAAIGFLGFDFSDIGEGRISLPLEGDIDFADPKTLLKVLPFTGWVGLVGDMFESMGPIAKGFEFSMHLAPGIVQGESFSDAFMADYGARLKLAAAVIGGQVLAGASTAASSALAQAGADVGVDSAEATALFGKIEAAAASEIGKDATLALEAEVADRIDKEINKRFDALVRDSDFVRTFQDSRIRDLSADDLAKRGLSPADLAARFGTGRQDVAALGANAIAHRKIFDVTARTFDAQTGKQRIVLAPSTTTPGTTPGSKLPTGPLGGAVALGDPNRPVPVLAKGSTVEEVRAAIQRAKKAGKTDAAIADLRRQYQALVARQNAHEAAIQAWLKARSRRNPALAFGREALHGARGLFELAVLTMPAWGVWLALRARP